MIEEATARNIPIEKYILHAGQKKIQKPVMMCKYSSGEVRQCVPDYNDYRFGFIEKTELKDFHILEQVLLRLKQRGLLHCLGCLNFKSL